MCFFCKCWGSPPQKILESRVMTYDSNIGCFLFLFLPKYMSMFNSINLIHPRSYLLNGGTWFFLGGMEIPTKFKQALTKSLNPVSRVFTQQVHRMFQMFACHFFVVLLTRFVFIRCSINHWAFQEDLLGAVWKWSEGLGMGQWRYQKDLPTFRSTLASTKAGVAGRQNCERKMRCHLCLIQISS